MAGPVATSRHRSCRPADSLAARTLPPGLEPTHSLWRLDRANVTLQPAASSASCNPAQFLAPLRPSVDIDGAGAAGLLAGAVNATTDPNTGTVTWSQALFSLDGARAAAGVLQARVLAGSVALGSAVGIPVQA